MSLPWGGGRSDTTWWEIGDSSLRLVVDENVNVLFRFESVNNI